MEDPDAEVPAGAAVPAELGELVGTQSVLLLRLVSLLVPGLAAAATADLLDQVWADYLASLFEPGSGGPVTTGLLTVLVSHCRALTGAPSEEDGAVLEPLTGGRFRPESDRWAGAWQVGQGPRDWLDDPRRPMWTREAVESLALSLREVLVLRDTAGLSATQVGAVLHRTQTEVRSLLHQARTMVWADLERRHLEAAKPASSAPVGDATHSPTGADEVVEPYPGDDGHRVICRQLVDLLTDYLEGTLDTPLAVDLEAHLAVCPECRLFVRQVRVATTQSGRLEAAHALPHALVETVLRRLNEVMQAHRR